MPCNMSPDVTKRERRGEREERERERERVWREREYGERETEQREKRENKPCDDKNLQYDKSRYHHNAWNRSCALMPVSHVYVGFVRIQDGDRVSDHINMKRPTDNLFGCTNQEDKKEGGKGLGPPEA